jgi:hypothetical protein
MINLTWAQIKTQVDTYDQTLHCETVNSTSGEKHYRLFVFNGAATYVCTLRENESGFSNADVTEFETNYLASVNQPMHNTRSDGVQRVQLVPISVPGMNLVLKGSRFLATLNATTNHDVTFEEARDLGGAWVEVRDHADGDSIELQVVHPNGTTVLGQFGETVYIPPSGILPQIISEGSESIPAGVKIRFKYNCIATVGTQPDIYCFLRTYKA